jgi:single-strand DNA-binding protein
MSNPNVVIVGRVGTEIDVKKMPSGTNMAKFRVITSDRKKNENGEWEDVNTSGWTVVAWDKLANKVINNVSKGDAVIVQGSMKEVSWVDAEGNKRKSTETRASEIAINLYSIKENELVQKNEIEELLW